MFRFRGVAAAGMTLVVMAALTGCASMIPSRHSFGVRPDVPVGEPSTEVKAGCETTHPAEAKQKAEVYVACLAFDSVVKWSADLEEAYRARTSLNRWAIYVGGTLGLAAAAASGALGAASAAGVGTLALLGISGGFSAAFFGFLNNGDLAHMYTVAAGEVATARSEARKTVDEAIAAKTNVASTYFSQAGALRVAVTTARNKLELTRTSDAMLAIRRAQTEREHLQEEIDKQKAAKAFQVLVKGQIIAIDDTAGAPVTAVTIGTGKTVVLTVDNVNLDGLSKDDLRVVLGERKTGERRILVEGTSLPDMTKPTKWKVMFTAPGTLPVPDVKEYSLTLIYGGETAATSTGTVKLKYN